MNCTLHDYQRVFLNDVLPWLDQAKHGDRRLYASPTGSGKSIMMLELMSERPGGLLITPRIEIIVGMLEKKGHPDASAMRLDDVVSLGASYGIQTPARAINSLSMGTLKRPAFLVFDEAHHSESDSWKALYAYSGSVPIVGLTATPFRGTPKGTAAFLSWWGDTVNRVLDYAGAIARGVLSFPEISVVGLLDDDVIEVSNGELSVKSLTKETRSRLGDLETLVLTYYNDGRFDMPTMVSVPSSEIAAELGERLGERAGVVTQATSPADRQAIFKRTLEREICLIHINVVSEGVDLPMRRLIDASPTLSPVKWQQQIGRIMRPLRPGEPASEYVCTNRNLSRHAYLLEGMVPLSKIAEAQEAFGQMSKRDAARAIGLEALSRFKPTYLPLLGGAKGIMYQVHSFEAGVRTEYAVLVHPNSLEPLYASRRNRTGVSGEVTYGRWQRIASIPDIQGFASTSSSPVSPKQKAWWEKSASRHGLDPEATVDRKNFAALPVLTDLRMKLGAT